MKKTIIKSIIISLLVLAIGYYAGMRTQVVNVTVHEMDPNGVETGKRSLRLVGTQLSGGTISDIYGQGIITKSRNIPWYITRASAIAAYLLMFVVVIWGTGMTTGLLYRLVQPTAAWAIHKFVSIAMSTLVFFHMGALLFDEYINFGLIDLLIPFASSFKTVYVGFGVLAFYILLVVMITSMFFKNKSERVWHLIHLSVYPLFTFALVHGIFTGTDSQTLGMTLVYWITGAVFGLSVLYRLSFYYSRYKIKSAA